MTKDEALKMSLEALELHGEQYPHMVKGYTLDAITAIKEALAQPDGRSFAEVHPRNLAATCDCEHWQSCADCHPTAHPQERYTTDAMKIRQAVARALAQPEQEPVLQDIEQYRMQMAGICTAAIGYWKEGDSISSDYDTVALRDVAKLYAKYDELYQKYVAQPEQEPQLTPSGIHKIGCVNHDCDKCRSQPEQEPVAWACQIEEADFEQDTVTLKMLTLDYTVSDGKHWLCTAPPKRQPLTDEQIEEIADGYLVDYRIPAGCAWNFARDIEAAHGIGDKT